MQLLPHLQLQGRLGADIGAAHFAVSHRPSTGHGRCAAFLLTRGAMKTSFADGTIRPLPRHVAVIGAAGGLGQGILDVCRTEGIGFTAIVRSRPERITNVPRGSQIAVVPSFTDCRLLREAFSGADAVLTALGVTTTSHDRSALLSANMATVEEAMLASQVDRILMINTLLAAKPGRPAS